MAILDIKADLWILGHSNTGNLVDFFIGAAFLNSNDLVVAQRSIRIMQEQDKCQIKNMFS